MGRHAAVPNNVIHSPANRNALYVGAAIIGIGAILSTLIMFGVLTEDQVHQWTSTAILMTGLVVTTLGNLLAKVNVPRREDGTVPEDPADVE